MEILKSKAFYFFQLLLFSSLFFILPSLGLAATYDSMLSLEDVEGSTGGIVNLDVDISGSAGKAGGVAFTVTYDSQKFTFLGITDSEDLGHPDAVDPVEQEYCGTGGCSDPFTDGGLAKNAIFYQFNEDPTGTILVSSASAQTLADNTTLFQLQFQIDACETNQSYDITISQTELPKNTEAGYLQEKNPITIMVGMPAIDPDNEGKYPVLDTFNTTPQSGSIKILSCEFQDSDNDGIDDNWEMDNFGNLTTADGDSDYDQDGYSDLVESQQDGNVDSNGNPFDPSFYNPPGETGYVVPPSGTPELGDVNGDGDFTLDDVIRAFELFGGATPTSPQEYIRANVYYADGSDAPKLDDVVGVFMIFGGGSPY